MCEASWKELALLHQWADVWENKLAGESFLGTCSIHPGRRHQTRLQQSHICNSDRLSEIGWDDLAGSVGTGFFRVAAQHFINDKTSQTNDNRKKICISWSETVSSCRLPGNRSWPRNDNLSFLYGLEKRQCDKWKGFRGAKGEFYYLSTEPDWLFPPIFVLSYRKLAVILSYLLYRHESGINLLI